MSLKPIRTRLEAFGPFREAVEWAATAVPGEAAVLRNAAGSCAAFVLAAVADAGRFTWCVLEDAEQAAYLHSDLLQVLRDEERVLLLPPSDSRPYDPGHEPDPAPVIQRADVLQRLSDGWKGVLVTGAEALREKLPLLSDVTASTVHVALGDRISPGSLIERLSERGFSRVEFVERPGDLALRGGILDVFPFVGDFPVRIEFFGDEIDSIREFDIHTQRSISRRTSARLVPDLDRGTTGHRIALVDEIPRDALVVVFDDARVHAALAARHDEITAAFEKRAAEDPGTPPPDTFYALPEAIRTGLDRFPRLLSGRFLERRPETVFDLETRPQPPFHGVIAELRKALSANAAQSTETWILCDSRAQEARIAELLEDDLEPMRTTLTVESLHEGFEAPGSGIAAYTDHQIFNRYHRPTTRRQKQRFGGISLRELQQLVPGDFVVHVDHGIGRFAGLEQIEVRGRQQEAVRLLYLSGDVLYVSVTALHKLHKYKGKDGHQPQLTKLGSGQWEKTKSRTKKRVKDIARDLIRLYAERKQSRGHAFGADSVWQREFEAAFEFEDTPDQAAAAEAVKTDMEQPVPMDRLVCGDVGFGKTEVAIRAAFKAVQDGKQVAVLVPTTVLAAQHARTFERRLRSYPVRIESMSRFRSGSDLKGIVSGLADGSIDVVIGTHRLISEDVHFKDLGLLIVDEEQRFGVGVKEKLRKLRVNVDTLTMTATPIPRTLQFSLMGARDLSVISTAPANRQPIVTEIHTFDKDLIRDAILYETSRGGQVFFIHNRVQSIHEIAGLIRNILPDLRVVVGHGQMTGPELEHVMLQFVERKADVLVSTSIIENGLDISNANTIIIDRADHFGLSELHQLRGRVGRSDRKAFCYLLVPSIHGLTREAKQRLQAVEEFSELGAGFQIAMRDLDIRGAGNMLGAEQSGFIEDVGFETYHRLLEEAVSELRSEEFPELFEQPRAPRTGETTVELDVDALIPESYLANRVERLNLYRRVSEATSAEELRLLEDEMGDRFGPPPDAVRQLMLGVEVKLLGQRLRLPRVAFKNERLFLSVPDQEADSWFYSHVFHPLLERLGSLDRRYVLKDGGPGKLRIVVQGVPTLDVAVDVLSSLQLEELVG